MEFHEHLKQLRTSSRYTQEQLARQLHVSRQTISSWEQGRTEPDIMALQQLCERFSTSLDTLLLERMEGYAVPYTFLRRLLLAHIPAALLLSAVLLYQKNYDWRMACVLQLPADASYAVCHSDVLSEAS